MPESQYDYDDPDIDITGERNTRPSFLIRTPDALIMVSYFRHIGTGVSVWSRTDKNTVSHLNLGPAAPGNPAVPGDPDAVSSTGSAPVVDTPP